MARFLFVFFVFLLPFHSALAAEKRPSTYDRVMSTGVIRCGYFVWPPFLDKDVNTGEMSGLYYDLTERIGQELSLKIEWIGEISWTSLFEGFETNKMDMICGPITATPARARASDFTIPITFYPTYLFSSDKETRFDNKYQAANDPSVKISILEGEMSQTIANKDFPKAQQVSVMSFSGAGDQLMALATGKVDLVVTEPLAPATYMENNPGKIKRVAGAPLRVLPISLAIPQDQYKFTQMINLTLQSLHDTGYIETLYKAKLPSDAYILPNKPYEVQ
jgi:ABC-type amino acid transport substrate-binding protein